MLQSYLVIAWRSLLQQKAFSLINLLGLALGMAASLLILEYARFELSYDQFHPKANQVYRVGVAWFYPNGELEEKLAGNFGAAGPALGRELPEVEAFARLRPWFGGTIIGHGPVSRAQDNIYFADPAVFSVFSFPARRGNPAQALSQPHAAVLSESAARQYFGNADPLGKVILLRQGQDQRPYTVRAVVADVPANSHLAFEVLLSYGDLGPDGETDWGYSMVYTYVRVRPGADAGALEKKGQSLLAKYRESKPGNPKGEVAFVWQPLTRIHLDSDLRNEPTPTGNGRMVYLLLAVGGFILTIAYANYVNLSTAKAARRVKEVGLRKAIGASRRMLAGQFMLEALLVNLLALVLAVTLVQVLEHSLSRWAGQALGFQPLAAGELAAGLAGLLGLSVLGSGAYPAWVLSGFKPIAALKGQVDATQRGHGLRRTLVVLQFTISLVLIAGTLLVYRQVSFMRTQPLGADLDRLLVVKAPVVRDSLYGAKAEAFKAACLAYPAIAGMTASSEVPGGSIGWANDAIRRKGISPAQAPATHVVGVDYDFVKTYRLRLLAGRDFNRQFGRDRKGLILNEAAVRVMGFASPQAAIGQPLVWDYRPDGEGFTVIGVIRNFHQQGLQHPFDPILLTVDHDRDAYFSGKLRPRATQAAIERVEALYKQFFPGNPFDYFFLDDHFAQQYRADQQFGEVFTLFAGLAVLLASMGLVGLVAYLTLQRKKEIGVRKVLGASLPAILGLLLKDVLRWMVLATGLAAPFTYWFAGRWLQTYAFRIEPGPDLLLLPALLVMLVALLSVGYQTLQAARANPVDSLRHE
jgi:putative ABC transport system permease protein